MKNKAFLVLVDGSDEFPNALQYAIRMAQNVGGRVAMLFVSEPTEGIETWGGVEQALDDEAFAQARETVKSYEPTIVEATGHKPVVYYQKGKTQAQLFELIDKHDTIAALVLAGSTKESSRNTLIQDLTTNKGLRKLHVPLIVVPDTCR